MGSNVFRYSARRYIFGLPFVLVDGRWKFDWHAHVKVGYIFKRLFLAFILYWVAWFLVMGNLWWYSVYYANNMPHKEGTDPVLALLVENLEWMNTNPPEGIAYDFDGYNSIGSDGPGDEVDLSGGLEYRYTDVNDIIYKFDKSFSFIKATDYQKMKKELPSEIDKSKINFAELKKEIYEFVDPVLKANDTKPFFNLQWVFNWYYYDRFN